MQRVNIMYNEKLELKNEIIHITANIDSFKHRLDTQESSKDLIINNYENVLLEKERIHHELMNKLSSEEFKLKSS